MIKDTSTDLKVQNNTLKWADAAKNCINMNGQLAIPTNEQELEDIQITLKNDDKVWIGRYTELTWKSTMSKFEKNTFLWSNDQINVTYH